ncbi:MAG: hypothetical protein ACUVUU_09560, partial [bacterium]
MDLKRPSILVGVILLFLQHGKKTARGCENLFSTMQQYTSGRGWFLALKLDFDASSWRSWRPEGMPVRSSRKPQPALNRFFLTT